MWKWIIETDAKGWRHHHSNKGNAYIVVCASVLSIVSLFIFSRQFFLYSIQCYFGVRVCSRYANDETGNRRQPKENNAQIKAFFVIFSFHVFLPSFAQCFLNFNVILFALAVSIPERTERIANIRTWQTVMEHTMWTFYDLTPWGFALRVHSWYKEMHFRNTSQRMQSTKRVWFFEPSRKFRLHFVKMLVVLFVLVLKWNHEFILFDNIFPKVFWHFSTQFLFWNVSNDLMVNFSSNDFHFMISKFTHIERYELKTY